MIAALGADAVRAAEAPLLARGVPLMDRAAFGLAQVVLREARGLRGARVLLLVGPGNNGGDALHAGAYLARRGVVVTAALLADRVHAGGLAALAGAGGRVLRGADMAAIVAAAAASDIVLDGLLGIGAAGALRGAAAEVVEALTGGREAGRGGTGVAPVIVAVDVPSGIGVDDGTLPGPVLPADVTVTFGAVKPGLLLPPAAHVVGRVEVVDVGLGLMGAGAGAAGRPALVRLDDDDVAATWPVPGAGSDKYGRGVLGVVAGTSAYPGAAVLTVSGAVRAGAGMVRYVGPDRVTEAVLAARPEVVAGPGRVQAWALGPGVDPDEPGQAGAVRRALAAALADGVPAAVDAGGLALLPDRLAPHVVLTPHAGELARLLTARGAPTERAEVEAAPLDAVRRAVELTGATVLLKGAVTVVCGPGGAVLSQASAPAWLATAGAGDVLAGVLGALLAGVAGAAGSADPAAPLGRAPDAAARLGALAAHVHGRAAAVASAGGPIAAMDVAAAVPRVLAGLLA